MYTITIGETRLVIKHTIAHTNTDVSFALISKLFSDSITHNPNPRVLKGPPQLPRHVLFVGTAGTQSLIYTFGHFITTRYLVLIKNTRMH